MDETLAVDRDIVWRPSPDYIQKSNLKKFMEIHNLKSMEELHRRSVEDISWFTDAIIKFLEIEFRKPYTRVVDLSSGIQFPVWCVDGKLNIVRSCIDSWAADPKSRDGAAVIWEGEEGSVRALSYKELALQVNRCANALRSLGFVKGDVIGLFMPMIPETIVALLAIARIGGVILPLFSGYGAKAVAQRLADSEAKGLFTVNGLFRRGRLISIKTVADDAIKDVSSIEHMIVIRRAGNEIPLRPRNDHWWHDLIPLQPDVSDIADTDAEDTLMIIYTSGTTGRPKGTVHTHCGFPIKAAQDMAFGTDVHKEDIIYWITDIGWMMGPWLIFGATILGATCFISDGAPDFPTPDRVWKMVADHKINVLGISPTFIRSLMIHGDKSVKEHDLSSIRFFASTSEPWNPDSWLWLFDNVGESKRPIINYSGGTEISGGIVMGNPLTPLKPASFSGPCPGIDADVVDREGKSVRGEAGELVIRSPWIGMTRGFWKDRQRYLDTYWSRWENLWVHGDRAAVDLDDLWYIMGRSDDTIKVAGKRVGPAEIESLLVSHPAVKEAAVIGIPHPVKGNEVICFCVLKKGEGLSEDIRAQLLEMIVSEMGKPLRPGGIEIVSDIPKTRNGKIMRRIIRAAYLDQESGDHSGLANPDAVDEIRGLGRALQK
jgi:acetyl-CoA synthetase